MAVGTPVIATAVGGVPELVQDGVSGLLVPPEDVDALAVAMLKLADDADLRRQLAQEASRRAKERFDVSIMVQGYEALYEGLLGKN
jgi:glycosyltransferase involved in cell wall biosynthesis